MSPFASTLTGLGQCDTPSRIFQAEIFQARYFGKGQAGELATTSEVTSRQDPVNLLATGRDKRSVELRSFDPHHALGDRRGSDQVE